MELGNRIFSNLFDQNHSDSEPQDLLSGYKINKLNYLHIVENMKKYTT